MTTVGSLTERLRIVQPVSTVNPDTGGAVPGTPVVIADVRGQILPRTGTEAFSTPQGLIAADLGIVNTASHQITVWFRPDVHVGQYVEYDDAKRNTVRHFEIQQVASPDERGQWLVLACVERVQ